MRSGNHGFTLIEMSIVLVIIGLVVGGVLVGRELIHAAYVRATITQIEKYNTAVNTFYGKYQALPGDMNASTATTFGFSARGSLPGEGDGNGIIEGCGSCVGRPSSMGIVGCWGEPGVFWGDLSAAGLIEGYYNAITESSGTEYPVMSAYSPSAAIGRGNQMYVWSGGMGNGTAVGANGVNYLGFMIFNDFDNLCDFANNETNTSTGLTVNEAYKIDTKIDDGFPQSGRVTVMYVVFNVVGWAGTNLWGTPPYTSATAGDTTTCFDNSGSSSGTPGIAGAAQHYSLEINNGTGINCALSFQMQGGD